MNIGKGIEKDRLEDEEELKKRRGREEMGIEDRSEEEKRE
jgi:hypothetical protein